MMWKCRSQSGGDAERRQLNDFAVFSFLDVKLCSGGVGVAVEKETKTMKCPKCGSTDTELKYPGKTRRYYKCHNSKCNNAWAQDVPQEASK